MSKLAPRIALDGFGTDARPEPEIAAALAAAREGIAVELVGDRARLAAAAGERAAELEAAVDLIDAVDEIAMDESPARAVRAKPDASLCVAVERVRAGEAAAVVSAGNSGAMLAASLFRLGRLPGVDRPAIVANLPQFRATGPQVRGAGPQLHAGGPSHDAVLLDAGANVECTAVNLVQFAVLGATWSRTWHGVARPRVAILSNGHEPGKGTAATREAHAILAAHAARQDLEQPEGGRTHAFEFIGYVEPHALFFDACDVVVTDGWTGNVALKLAEGAMAAWPHMLAVAIAAQDSAAAITAALAPALAQLTSRLDPDAHGGAPLLGVDGAVIICHGAAGPAALLAALRMAHRAAELGVFAALRDAVVEHHELFELAKTKGSKHGTK